MSEAQKEIAARIVEGISKIPEKDGYYILGQVEARAAMAEEAKEANGNE